MEILFYSSHLEISNCFFSCFFSWNAARGAIETPLISQVPTLNHPPVECRIVTSEELVQLGLRGVPIDFVNQGAWEEIVRRESELETRELERGRAGA